MYKDISTIETVVTDLDALKNSIRNILLTPIGSLPGRPSFGSNIHKVIFGQMDHLTESVAKNYVIEALDRWEDRIYIEAIEIKRVEEFNKIIIDISFTYLDSDLTNVTDNVSVSINV